MRRAVLVAITVGGVAVPLVGGTALAMASDRPERRAASTAGPAAGPGFELEIDPELDARFGPRPVNAVQAAQIVTARFGGRVVKAELDEEDGGPIWEIDLVVGGDGREVEVDAVDGAILGGDGGQDTDDVDGGADD